MPRGLTPSRHQSLISPDISMYFTHSGLSLCIFRVINTQSLQIGINLADPIYRGKHRGVQRHPDDLKDVISRAKEVGCTKLIVTGSDFTSARDALELAREFRWYALGPQSQSYADLDEYQLEHAMQPPASTPAAVPSFAREATEGMTSTRPPVSPRAQNQSSTKASPIRRRQPRSLTSSRRCSPMPERPASIT